MDRQSVARVFEPVFATGPEAATGLGLAMAYGVVDQAGGCLRVHSEPGLGTVYSAWFPVVSDVSAQVEVTRAVPDRGRILLAEDDAGVTTVVRAALERDGHLLVATADGEQAWARFSAEPEGFDLLITDLVMARLGGRDLAMRVIAAAPNLPILFVSGYSAGAAALPLDERRRFLGKPFRPSDLTRAVRELLSLSTRPPR
jgi:CheY-like chemotaxis protein